MPLVASLVTVPIYLSLIGLDRYGVLTISWLLLGYFNFFDFGLGRAISQKIALLAQADAVDRSRIFWTGFIITAALSLVAMLVLVPVVLIGLAAIQVNDAIVAGEIDATLPWLIASLPIGIMSSLFVGALEGRREFLRLNLITSFGTIVTSLLPLSVAWLVGPQLWHLLAAALIGRAITVSLLASACLKTVPVLRPSRPDAASAAALLKFGGWTSVSNIIGPLLVLADRLVIGAIIGAAAVALYVVPFTLVSQLLVLPAALTIALFPRLTSASFNEARSLSRDAVAMLAFLLTPMALAAIALSGPFLTIWLGSALGQKTAPIAYLLFIGFWSNSLAQVPARELQARGRPEVLAGTHVAELVPYVVLLYLALRFFGVHGAALVWSARCLSDAIILHFLAGGTRAEALRLTPHALLVALGIAAAYLLPMWSPIRWALLGTLLLFSVVLVIGMGRGSLLLVLAGLKSAFRRPRGCGC